MSGISRQGSDSDYFWRYVGESGSERSLAEAKAEGGDVRVVYGINKAIEIAEKEDNDVVFMAAGFETTAPTTAAEILAEPLKISPVLSCHRLIPSYRLFNKFWGNQS